jgi:hypothetical protein
MKFEHYHLCGLDTDDECRVFQIYGSEMESYDNTLRQD